MIEEQAPKKKILPKIILIFLGILIFFIYYIRFFEPTQLEILEYAIRNEKIPDSFAGFKIVQFSDIHFGKTTNEKELTKVMDKIALLKPDILVYTGDLFDNSVILSEETKKNITDILKKSNATIGKYAILGDQDYLQNGIEEILTNAGFTILKNQNVPIYYNGTEPIYVSGIPSITKKEEDLTTALAKEKNGYQILLIHEPILFSEISNADLVLAGHTLGGLVRLPFIGGMINLPNTDTYQKGKYEKKNSLLYVSSGIGTQNIPIRFLNYPSITIYRLYPKD